MIDYRLHLAALDAFREQLALTPFSGAALSDQRDEQIAAADQASAAARLGSLIDHLIWHASSDGRELDLLDRAATTWDAGRELYDALAEFRLQLETVMADPSDGDALQKLNSASTRVQPLVQKVLTHLAGVQALRAEVATMEHLPPHPRQEDLRVSEWKWADIFLARRTDAFAREARNQVGDTETSAFAFGILSSYGANAAGSAYIAQVVGGPRRAHRRRDRLARNSVGSWAATHEPSVPQLGDLVRELEQAFPDGLPPSLEALIRSALENTYDPGVVPPIPDLELGYQRLIQHLRLLDRFQFPDSPALPREPFLSILFGDPNAPYTPSMPEGTGIVEAGQPPLGEGEPTPSALMPQNFGTDDGPTHSEPPDSTEVKCGSFWEALGWSVLFLLGGWFACVIRWQDGDRCQLWDDISQNWEQAFPNGASASVELSESSPQPLTRENVEAIVQVDQIPQLIGDLSNLQNLLWEGFNKSHEFLAVYGLVYPDKYLQLWRYRQYHAVPSIEPGSWPLLPDTGPRFDEYPITSVELPASFDFAYQTGATPAAVLARVPGVGTLSAADLSQVVWEQMARGDLDANNLDLDADREWRHPCWAPAGSIADQPIDAVMLGYDET